MRGTKFGEGRRFAGQRVPPNYLGLARVTFSCSFPSYDDLPTVTLATTVPNATESGSAGKFTVKLANGVTLDHDLLVRYTLGGTAVNGDDYRMLSGDVIIPAGAASATISINPIDVALANGSQTVVLTLAASADYHLCNDTAHDQGTVTIKDDAPLAASVYALQPIGSMASGLPIKFVIQLNGVAPAGGVRIYFTVGGTAQAGIDYYPIAQPWVTFPGGVEGSALVEINPILNANCQAIDKTVILSLLSPFSGVATGAFCDDPATTYAVVPDAPASSPWLPQFTVSRSGSAAEPAWVDVDFNPTGSGAAAGTDFNYTVGTDPTAYGGGDGSVYFPAGVSSVLITIDPLYVDSASETTADAMTIQPDGSSSAGGNMVTVELDISGTTYNAAPPNQEATITISDADSPCASNPSGGGGPGGGGSGGGNGPSASNPPGVLARPSVCVGDAEVFEGDSEQFTVTLSHAMPYDLPVTYSTSDGTAVAGVDYTGESGTLDFPAGTTTQTITVPTLLDAADTTGMFFYVTVGDPSTGKGDIKPVTGDLTPFLGVAGAAPLSNIILLRENSTNPGGPSFYSNSTLDPGIWDHQHVDLLMTCGKAGDGVFRLDYSPTLAVYGFLPTQNVGGKSWLYTDITSGETFAPGTQVELFVYGTTTSQFLNDSSISLNYVSPGSAVLNLRKIKATVASVSLLGGIVESNYRDASGNNIIDTSPDGDCATAGTPYSNTVVCDEPSDPEQLTFCQQMGTHARFRLVLDVEPIGLSYLLYGNGNYLSFFDCGTSSGAPSTMVETSLVSLPGTIAHVQKDTLRWTVSMGGGISEQIGVITNDIFTTYGEPITAWSSAATNWQSTTGAGANDITYERLNLVTSSDVCGSAKCIDDAASKVNNWSYGRPYIDEATATTRFASLATTASELWAVADGSEDHLAYCMQFAGLEEMMLGQVGIPAVWEALLPTKDLVNGQVRFFSASIPKTTFAPITITRPLGPGMPQKVVYDLAFHFSTLRPNDFEGGIRVGTWFYPQHFPSSAAGHDNAATDMTAERAALKKIDKDGKLQQYASGFNWYDEYVPAP